MADCDAGLPKCSYRTTAPRVKWESPHSSIAPAQYVRSPPLEADWPLRSPRCELCQTGTTRELSTLSTGSSGRGFCPWSCCRYVKQNRFCSRALRISAPAGGCYRMIRSGTWKISTPSCACSVHSRSIKVCRAGSFPERLLLLWGKELPTTTRSNF